MAKLDKLPEGFRSDLCVFVTAISEEGQVANSKITLGGSVNINLPDVDFEALGRQAIKALNAMLGVDNARLMTREEVDAYLEDDADERGVYRHKLS